MGDVQIRKTSFIKNHKQFKLLIPDYPEGSDLTLLNTAYKPRRYIKDEAFPDRKASVEKDYLIILFKDNVKGVKRAHIIYEPLYTFYKLKDEYQEPPHNLFFIEKEKVDTYTCKYADILKAIAEVTDNAQFFMDNVNSGQASKNQKLHTCTNIFMSDMNIENYYRFLFNLSYKNEACSITKAFLDIETDGSYSISDFPESGEVPINAISYCDESHDTTYQFILNDRKNPLVQKYKDDWESGKISKQELHDFVVNAVGGYKKAVKYGVDKMQYRIVFFDSEIEMISTMFDVINKTIPDFILVWNMAFDLKFIIDRIQYLGYDPNSIICDDRIGESLLKFYVDERNKNEFAERGDFVNISSFSVWLDQMIQFASRRKGRAQYQSFSLDSIGEVVANVRKLDYSHITKNITMLPYLDMKTFSFYNIMDVIVQKCIEKSTQDCEYIFTKCLVNNTVYPKGHRQSIYLANRFAKEFFEYGYIIGNNKNKWNEKPEIKFPGAMVGDPLHNSKSIYVKINGVPTYITENAIDFDFSSLYPSIILENNMAPNTQIGRLVIEDPDNPNRKFSLNEHQDMYINDEDEDKGKVKYSRGGEFLDNYMTDNVLEFCRRWLGLGDIHQVIDDIKEFYTYNSYSGKPIDWSIKDTIYYSKDSLIDAIIFENEYMNKPAIRFEEPLSDSIKENLKNKIEEDAIL